jgi:hypothetical protein
VNPVPSDANIIIGKGYDGSFGIRDSPIATVRQSLLRFKKIFQFFGVLCCQGLHQVARFIGGIIVYNNHLKVQVRIALRKQRPQSLG